MPIKVFCPNGCIVRVPSNRAGKIVRCPTCKSIIRVDKNKFSGEARLDRAGKVQAELVKLEQQLAEADSSFGNASDGQLDIPVLQPVEPVEQNGSVANLENVEATPNAGLIIPKPVSSRFKRAKVPTTINPRPEPIRFGNKQPEQPEQPDRTELKTPDEEAKLKKRASSARKDRIVLARFFASCLVVAGLVNLGPAIYYWVQWSQTIETSVLPRWIYLQVFVAAIHFVYAVFIVQILDWAALRAVGYAMLGMAVLFGIVSTGLLLGGDGGVVSQFLELPFAIVNKALIWCVAMLVLSTLLCYVIGRESINWERIEQLLDQILTGKSPGRI